MRTLSSLKQSFEPKANTFHSPRALNLIRWKRRANAIWDSDSWPHFRSLLLHTFSLDISPRHFQPCFLFFANFLSFYRIFLTYGLENVSYNFWFMPLYFFHLYHKCNLLNLKLWINDLSELMLWWISLYALWRNNVLHIFE